MSRLASSVGGESLTFKVASEPAELEQIHRLNYKTFVEEIPQHAPNGTSALVDKFDRDNTYIICLRGDRVVGMTAMRFQRPFSLDAKLENLDSFLPDGLQVCEVRLLAVEPEHRTGIVFRGLIYAANEHGRRLGVDGCVLSATVRQLKLYRHMGFVPFGPLVGSAEAPFQPMYVTRQALESSAGQALQRSRTAAAAFAPAKDPESFLPGPVNIPREVLAAFTQPVVSHRHPEFAENLKATQRALCALVGAARVQLLVGSGTLANDAVAAQLSLLKTPGVILSNGEFGERLVDHAVRTRLSHSVVRVDWGHTLDIDRVREALSALPSGSWCWMTHCETSSGILNDLDAVRAVCNELSIRLCVDCVSSIGTVPVSLHGVYLASCVSGKGLSGLPGLSMVFYHHAIAPSTDLPRYLDLGFYADRGGVPFTQSSNLLAALRVAVERTAKLAPFADVAELATWMRGRLRAAGFQVLAPEAQAAPGIVTLPIRGEGNGTRLGDAVAAAGFELNYRSDYLRTRDWVQVALMGECSRARVEPLLSELARAAGRLQ